MTSPRNYSKKITYLLGTSHHGSKKSWSPFAESKEVFRTYLSIAEQEESEFQFDPNFADQTASELNTDLKKVRERLAVYRAMKQLSETDEMKSAHKGGIIDAYYSIVRMPSAQGISI